MDCQFIINFGLLIISKEHFSLFIILLMNKENSRLYVSRSSKGKDNRPVLTESHPSQLQTTKFTNNESYKVYMKYLIASNAEYFQSKIQGKQPGRPKDIKFKMPSHTGMTIYKQDYKRKKNKFNEFSGIKHDKSMDSIKTNNFLKEDEICGNIDGKTTYQKEFKYHNIRTQSQKRFQRRLNTHEKEVDDIPRFFQTQNKTDFLNWAGKNYVPSMKPEHKCAATNLPFDAKSIYKADFQGRKASPTPFFTRQASFPKFGCSSQVLKTSYNYDFPFKKREGIEIDCKPRYSETSLCKHLKGTTEYKRQFISSKNNDEAHQATLTPTLNQIQTIIIDL